MLARLLLWAKAECDRRGIKPSDFLEYFRSEVRKKVLDEERGYSNSPETASVP